MQIGADQEGLLGRDDNGQNSGFLEVSQERCWCPGEPVLIAGERPCLLLRPSRALFLPSLLVT